MKTDRLLDSVYENYIDRCLFKTTLIKVYITWELINELYDSKAQKQELYLDIVHPANKKATRRTSIQVWYLG